MKIVLTEQVTFKDLIAKLNDYGSGFLAIVDSKNKLVGILTDGDVRRAILNDVQDIQCIFNKNPVTVPEGTPRQKIISLLKDIHRKHMPVVDNNGKLTEVISLDEIEFNHKPNHVFIMAGGLGTRLGELTKNTPKPMLNIGTKPMIVHIIEAFKDFGYTHFTISVNYKSEQIKNYFKDGSNFGVHVDYIEEKKRLGTAGALSLLKNTQLHPFFVINGDVLTSLNFEDLMVFHVGSLANATMCVREYEMEVPYGVINTDLNNNILDLQEKPVKKFLINSGVYVLNPSALSNIPSDEYFDMPTLFEELIAKGLPVKTYQISDYWIDVGSVDDFQNANARLTKENHLSYD